LRIREALNYSRLTSLLASQIGQLVNTSEISNTLDIKQETIHGYLRVLEQTFICYLLRPFFRNFRKELTKMPKIYFWDNGLRNFALESFRDFERREDRGILLENFVFSELGRQQSGRIRYWRTKDKSEVDFVLEHQMGTFIPIEVKAQILKKPELPRSLSNFIKRYAPRQSFVVNFGLHQKIRIGKTDIFFIYPFQLAEILKNF
jgi:predicted AAA+ superfamily ATPase